jgi:CRP-like cAMP-binding protein
MQLNELFQRIDLFSGLDDEILRKLAEAAVPCRYGRDEVIIRQGQMGLGLYIIVRGRVKVEREQPGGIPMKVAELGPERFFAEMSIMENRPWSDTVTALEETTCLLLPRESFVSLMLKHPEIPIRVARLLAERLRLVDEKLASVHAPLAGGGATAFPSSNGLRPVPPPEDRKQNVQRALLDMFQNLYALRAFTRFSVAVLGCPVEGSAPNLVTRIRVGDVEALVFPGDEPVNMSISASRPGHFTVHVFLPEAERPKAFGPVAIHPLDEVALRIEKGRIALHLEQNSCDNT